MKRTFGKSKPVKRIPTEIFINEFARIGATKIEYTKSDHTTSELPKSKRKKSLMREWRDALVFAIFFACIIRTFGVEAYVIPSGSMENSLLVGDFLFVSKFNFGARLPMTPIAFPFAHDTIPVIKTKAYWDGLELPYFRLPGTGKVERLDAVVFNKPSDTIDHRPVDKRENLIKRCIGLPGESLKIINGQVYVNEKLIPDRINSLFSYHVITDGTALNEKVMDKLGIEGADSPYSDGSYLLYMTTENVKKLKRYPSIKSVIPVIENAGIMETNPIIFPGDSIHSWNQDNFGPLLIPKKGISINLDINNIAIYKRAIVDYEHNKLSVIGNKLFINGHQIHNYVFKMDYYWMMGDNRHNSLDSRFWGFVPEDHIVGKALFVWMSIDDKADFLSKIRWNRLFTSIK